MGVPAGVLAPRSAIHAHAHPSAPRRGLACFRVPACKFAGSASRRVKTWVRDRGARGRGRAARTPSPPSPLGPPLRSAPLRACCLVPRCAISGLAILAHPHHSAGLRVRVGEGGSRGGGSLAISDTPRRAQAGPGVWPPMWSPRRRPSFRAPPRPSASALSRYTHEIF